MRCDRTDSSSPFTTGVGDHLLQVLVINDQHRTIRVMQRCVARRPEQLLHFSTIACTRHNHLNRSGVLGQVVDDAAVHHHRLHVLVRKMTGPLSEPAVKLGL
jgi:hypothetical protein